MKAAEERDDLNALQGAYSKYAFAWRMLYDEKDRAARAKMPSDNYDHESRMIVLKAKVAAESARFKVELEEKRLAELSKPRDIPDVPFRYEHTHILAPSGQGKTTLIQQLLLNDLKKANPPGYIIIDPKGLLVERVSRLAVFDPDHGRLRDRLVIIDPTHQPAPPLNMFKPTDTTGVSEANQRRITNHLTEAFIYIFSSKNFKLTPKQTVPFAFLARLVFSMGGTINTLMDLLEEKKPSGQFAEAIAEFSKRDDAARRFFEKDFYDSNFGETKSQIRARIYDIISKADLMEMFASTRNCLDISACMAARKIVLVNTSLNQLGKDGSQLLGRYIISLTLTAAFARSTIPKSQWHPTYLVIDEFQDFADEQKSPELLRLAREYNLGVTLAHQQMYCDEMNDSLRTAISTNTAIKYCAGPKGLDINYMARDLECDAAFLKAQERTSTHAKFACYVRGMNLSHPFRVETPLGNIDAEPKMTEASYQKLIDINAAWLAGEGKPLPPISAIAPSHLPFQPKPAPPSGPALKRFSLFGLFKAQQPPTPSAPLQKTPPSTPSAPEPPPPTPKLKSATPASDDDDLPTTWGNGTIKR
ncbi:MAG: hypothetical protein AAB403_13145 [Planctomycetota bacterium]